MRDIGEDPRSQPPVEAANASGSLGPGDWAITALSLVVVFGIGMYSTVKKRKGSVADNFFLAGRSMPWWIQAASLFASNIGTEHFVGQAGAAAAGGIAVGLYEWTAAYLLLLLGWFFAPVYLRCSLTTIPEFLEQRYNKWCRGLFVIITLVAYVLSKIGASLYAGAVVFEVVLGMGMWVSSPLIIVGTALYTVAGGLTAVMFTDTVQMFMFVIGGFIGTHTALKLVGGMTGLFSVLRDNGQEYMTHMLHNVHVNDFPWPGMLIGQPIASIWYWCIDQEMAQRVLSSENLEAAQLGTAAAGFMKIMPVFITVVPGMVARALFESCTSSHGAAFPQWCGTHLDDAQAANRAYPMLVVKEFPTGVKGVMVASFLAAMMSSLSAVFNSAATVFTYDVYERFAYGPEGNGPPRILVNVGRITTVALTFLTFMWLPVIQASQQSLYIVAQNAMTHVAPPVTAIFLAALLWRRANGEGALAALAAGSITGGIRLVVTMMSQDYCSSFVDPVTRVITLNGQNWFRCLNFNYFSMALFVFSLTILVAVSLCYPPPHEHKLAGRMFHSELLSNALRIILRRKAPASGGSVNMPHTHYSRFVSTDNDPLPSTPRLPPPTESSAEFTEVMAATNHGRVSEDPTPASETRRLQEDDWGDMGTEDEDKDPVLGACSCRCHWFGAHQGKLANVFAAALVIVVSTLIGALR